MSMSDCEKCWETPCDCGHEGYSVLRDGGVHAKNRRPLFYIKPLQWEPILTLTEQKYEAVVPMGSYTLYRCRKDDFLYGDWSPWTLRYSFDEYDAGTIELLYDTLDLGQSLAMEDWIKRILPALESVIDKHRLL